MSDFDKWCPGCGKEMRCVFTGAYVQLEREEGVHCCDLFMCHDHEPPIFTVWGMNLTMQPGVPDAVQPGPYGVLPYPRQKEFATVAGVVPLVLLPSAIAYIRDKCWHRDEIRRYLTKPLPVKEGT